MMEKLSGHTIRELFLSFYESKKHIRLSSASLIPEDPQLLFTVAGMVPFKPIFWGKVEPTYTRVTTCQKCVRTNDIEQVGRTPRHHTFFEMLGNFSFGDYFKREAIDWAWEFVIDVLKLPEEKIYVSVYKDDQEAYDLWQKHIGLPPRKITRLGKADNFWGPAGPTGPCGPDSEIFFDMGPKPGCPDPEHCAPGCDCGRFLEFYNLVFTEFNQDEKGNLTPLARKNIDTGLGLERLAAIMQGVSSNFESDLFTSLIQQSEAVLGLRYGSSEPDNVALRVVADHIRSAVFMITDGILPSNEGRGYVLKRLIRRAMRFGWLYGQRNPFLHRLVEPVVSVMRKPYPEIENKVPMVTKIIQIEEEKFLKTLEQGMTMLDTLTAHSKQISGDDAFRLYDTFGFPIEVTQEVAQERGLGIDMEGYRDQMKKQRETARSARGDKEFLKMQEIYESIGSEHPVTPFIGYEQYESASKVLYLVREGQTVPELRAGEEGEMVIESTPFFSEKGGQVTDWGSFCGPSGEGDVVYAFNPFNQLVSHQIIVKTGTLKAGETVSLSVDLSRRRAIARNHTATHLLHAALRALIGDHIKQAGSMVEPDRLRFDFTHYEKIRPEQVEAIENWVNERILMAVPVSVESHSIQEAKAMGAMALFDEKYKETVRVVQVGTHSMELCGGTHVQNSGEIGLFKILNETAISAGMRRIEAITGMASLAYLRKQSAILSEACQISGSQPESLAKTIEKTLEEQKEAEKTIRNLQEKWSLKEIGRAEAAVHQLGEASFAVIHQKGLQKQSVRSVTDKALEQQKTGMVILFNEREEMVDICVKVAAPFVQNPFHAGKVAQRLASELGGGGGGKADFAVAGGKHPEKMPTVLDHIDAFVNQTIG